MQVTYQARKASRPGFTSFGDRQSSRTWKYEQMCLTRLNKSTMCFGETWLNPSIRLPGIPTNRIEPLTLESACSRIPLHLPWLGKIGHTPGSHVDGVSFFWIYFYGGESLTEYIPAMCLTFHCHKPTLMWLLDNMDMLDTTWREKMSTDLALCVTEIITYSTTQTVFCLDTQINSLRFLPDAANGIHLATITVFPQQWLEMWQVW